MESADQGAGVGAGVGVAVGPETLVLPPSSYLGRSSLELPGGLSFEEWQKIGDSLVGCGTAVQWWLGDWLTYGEQSYGERYAQAVGGSEQTGIPIDTIRKYQWVADRIPAARRRTDLSWSHHEAVASIEDPHAQAELLRIAAEKLLSVREMRESAKQIRQVLKPGAAPAEAGGGEGGEDAVGRPTPPTEASTSAGGDVAVGWRPALPSAEPAGDDEHGPDDHEPDPVAEWVRAESENEELRARVALLEQDDAKRALSEMSEKYARLEGRLQQALTTQGEAEKQAKYYGALLEKVRQALGVQSNRDILAAIRAKLPV